MLVTLSLSIVVVSWNTRNALAKCLDSVAVDPLGREAEVWVVDNASSDGSAEMVSRRYPSVHLLVSEANLGFAAGCNRALLQATGDVVVLVNSDALLEEDTLGRFRSVLEARPDVGVVGGQLVGLDGRPQRSYGGTPSVGAFVAEMFGLGSIPGVRQVFPAVASPPRRRERPRAVGYVSGACLAFRRELLQRIGFLDERFFLYFEETDFCLRVRREAGLLVWFEPSARTRHQGQASAVQLGPEAEVQYARSAHAFVLKHHGPWAARRLSVAFRVWLAAHLLVHRLQALARRPGAPEALARKQRLRRLHRDLGRLATGGRRAA